MPSVDDQITVGVTRKEGIVAIQRQGTHSLNGGLVISINKDHL